MLTLTIPDATKLTLIQLRAAIVPDKRAGLIALNGSDKISDAPIIVRRKDGLPESQTETVRDVETGAVVSGRRITWTYYKTGEVDTITIVETDAVGKETSRKIIKHYIDGRQPEVLG
jgi:hypothetical protein